MTWTLWDWLSALESISIIVTCTLVSAVLVREFVSGR